MVNIGFQLLYTTTYYTCNTFFLFKGGAPPTAEMTCACVIATLCLLQSSLLSDFMFLSGECLQLSKLCVVGMSGIKAEVLRVFMCFAYVLHSLRTCGSEAVSSRPWVTGTCWAAS